MSMDAPKRRPVVDPWIADLAHWALEESIRAGATQSAVAVGQGHFMELERRDGVLEKVRAADSRGLSLALYLDGRHSAGTTSCLSRASLKAFIESSVAMTRLLRADPHRALPAPHLYGGGDCAGLDLWDPQLLDPDVEQHRDRLAMVESAARGPDSEVSGWSLPKSRAAIVSVRSRFTARSTVGLQLHSNGFRGTSAQTGAYLGATVTVRDRGGTRPEEHCAAAACHLSDLRDPKLVGSEASARARARVGARIRGSGVAAILVESRAAAGLVRSLLGALSGPALQQHRSFLVGCRGQSMGSDLLDLSDEPHLIRAPGSRIVDGDGLGAKPLQLVRRGVVENWLLDVYHGRKLGMDPTTGSISNAVLAPGKRSPSDLLRELGHGAFITGFLGGNSSRATGDFSHGITGFWVERGVLTHPIRGMNMTGNHRDLWSRLVAVGDDPNPHTAVRVPSLIFADVMLSGRG